MARGQISRQQVDVFKALLTASDWITSAEVAEQTGVSHRTARKHLFDLVQLGIIEQRAVSPGHRYKVVDDRARSHAEKLRPAAEALGVRL